MSTQWIRSSEVVWEELGSETLLVSPTANSGWVLNASAAHIWKRCNECSLDELARELARAGNRQLNHVKEELRAFCQSLEASGLLHSANAPKRATAAGNATAVGNASAHVSFSVANMPMSIRAQNFGAGPRRRPSPRGLSSPA